jgi:drug/metabolite transporter (DMT)-like permease
MPALCALGRSPLLLLAVCGFLLAARFMLAKAALEAGATPVGLVFVMDLGAGLCLLAIVVGTGQAIPRTGRHLALYAGLGVLGFALPALLANAVVARVGPGYASTVYALSPLLTMSAAAGFGIERLTARRAAGIALGFLGMLVVVREQATAIDVGRPAWVLAGLLLPAAAAAGNIVRTAFWPPGTSPLAFSCATLLTSSAVMAIPALALEAPAGWPPASPGPAGWVAGLVVVASLSYVLNYRLQRIAGPVVFSQIGYWGAAFGLGLAALFFGDVPTSLAALGVAGIVCGGLVASAGRGAGGGEAVERAQAPPPERSRAAAKP